jgi:hypothetical protein
MRVLKVIIGVLILFVIAILYAACIVSGEGSRMEREGKLK